MTVSPRAPFMGLSYCTQFPVDLCGVGPFEFLLSGSQSQLFSRPYLQENCTNELRSAGLSPGSSQKHHSEGFQDHFALSFLGPVKSGP